MDLSCLACSVHRQACPGLAEDTLLPANGVKGEGSGGTERAEGKETLAQP
jgi:hypothetical protein